MKDVSAMTAGELNKALDALDKKETSVTTEMIAAGRGYELPTDTIKKSDPLAKRMKENFERRHLLLGELDRRYGPGAPSRMPTTRRKNPTPKYSYLLQVQKSEKSPVLIYNGNSFASSGAGVRPPKVFSRADTAKRTGKKLLKEFPILNEYRMWVESKFHTAQPVTQKERAKRGGSKAPKANPSRRQNAELDEAAKRLEDFSGHPVQHLESAYSRSDQSTGLIVGELDLIGYRAKRDGKTERYGHHFKKNSRPLLAVTSDGKQLHIVGGQYEFTEAGIEDR